MDRQQQQYTPENSPFSTGAQHPQATDAPHDASATAGATDNRGHAVASPMAAPMAAPMPVLYPAYPPLGGHHEEPFLHGESSAPPGTAGLFHLSSSMAMDLDPTGFVAGTDWQPPDVGVQYSNVEAVASMNVFEYFPYDDQQAQRNQSQEPPTLRFDRAFMPSEPPPGYPYPWGTGSGAPSSAYGTAVAIPAATTAPAPFHGPPYRPGPAAAAALPPPAHVHAAPVYPIPSPVAMPPPMLELSRADASSTSSEIPRSSSSSTGQFPMYGNPTNPVAADAEDIEAGGAPGRRSTRQTTRRAKTVRYRRPSASTSRRSGPQSNSAPPLLISPLAGSSSEGSASLSATASSKNVPPAPAPATTVHGSSSDSTGGSVAAPLQESIAGAGPVVEDKKPRGSHNLVEKQYRNRLNAQFKGLMNSLPRDVTALSGSGDIGIEGGTARAASPRGEMAENKHHSKAEVLELARIHIQALEQERDILVRERDELLRSVQALQGGYGVPLSSSTAPRQGFERSVVGQVDEEGGNDDDDDDDDDGDKSDVDDADVDADADVDTGGEIRARARKRAA